MVHIERVPIARVSRAVVYENDRKLPLSKIVEEEAPDLAFTGAFYNPGTWSPVCPVKADGVVLHADKQYDYWALAWNKAADVGAELVPAGRRKSRAELHRQLPADPGRAAPGKAVLQR